MARDAVLFRGTKQGLLIVIAEEGTFAEVCAALQSKLEASGDFFRGAEVTLQIGRRELQPEERSQLERVLREPYQLTLRAVEQGNETPPPTARSDRPAQWTAAAEALVIKRTLRSGQAVRHNGDVIVLGDVNAGAEVVATGHIVVLGALRGVAHAGSAGDMRAVVAANRLLPTQLRIGPFIGRPPDDSVARGSSDGRPEVARVADGAIVIEGMPTA